MAEETLRGWNAISEFLSCDVRTAKRWEQSRHLPVHRTRRTPGEGRPNVYAHASELEAWLASANPIPELSQPAELLPQTIALTPPPVPVPSPPAVPRAAQPHWRRFAFPAAGAAFIVAALILSGTARKIAANRSSARADHPIASPIVKYAQAPELYLHGSYLLEQRTAETLQQARLDFQSVIAASPKYAPAYAGLAKTYALLCEYSTLPASEAYPLARQSALQAIALDPNSADAHAALGYEEFFWEWDAFHAEAQFKRAIALDPNSSLAHLWYGSMLLHQTRYAESLAQLNQAQLLMPDSAGVLGMRAYALGLSGERDQAVDLEQDILARVPDSAPLHFTLAQLCLKQPRDIPRYLDQMRRFAELRHSGPMLGVLQAGESAYRNSGEQAMWKAMLHAERRQDPDPNHPTYFIARWEAAQGMNDSAVHDLNLLLHDHNAMMIGIEIDPLLTPLRGDPRFMHIASQVGLPLEPSPAGTSALNR